MATTSPAGNESGNWSIEVRVVGTPDEYAMVMAIRAATFLAEEDNITYFDEFGGNDFVATHLLAFVNGDPAGVIRMRWFKDFAVMERLGIRKRYRSYKVFAALARAAIDHARTKGYRAIAGHARGEVYKLWQRFWGKRTGPEIVMYRGTLIPMVVDVPVRPNDLTIPNGPFGDPDFEDVITQTEGAWQLDKLHHRLAVAAE